jgi:outer membrane protein OmpA-like peptidoglycan-associated protein
MTIAGRIFALSTVALVLGGVSARSQERGPAYSTEQLIGILKPNLGATRSLSPGTGAAVPQPGTNGSGLLPDLKILFPFNSAELNSATLQQLDTLGAALQSSDLATFRFEIAGHTDAAGPDSYNEGLSERRAAAVTGYLEQSYGIDPARLEPRGYGKSQLIDPANPTSPRNRRVEVITLTQ